MRISLIQAAVSDTPFPPVGILYIAGVLERAGISVQVLHPAPGEDGFLDEVVKYDAEVIGFSLTTPQVPRVKYIRDRLKAELPQVFFIAGGPHATVCPEETVTQLGMDVIVMGEGEETVVELCERLASSRDLSEVRGLYIRGRDGERGHFTGERGLIADLDILPYPARHLIDFEKYLGLPGIIRGYPTGPSTAVFSGRGCAFDCIFCSSKSMFHRKVRKRSVENVLSEIRFLRDRYGIEAVFFPDEAFISGKKWVMEFCDGIQDMGIQWACQSRVDMRDRQLFDRMKQAGCVQLEFGVESGSPRVLKTLRKQTDPDMVRQAFKAARASKLRTLATFMVGSPGEEMEDIRRTEELALEIKADFTAFFFLVPYPGTDLYDMAVANKWIPEVPDYFTTSWFIRQSEYPVMAIHFSPEELSRIRGRLQNRFIFRNYFSYLKSGKFVAAVLMSIILHPVTMLKALIASLHTRRLDHVLEKAFVLLNSRVSRSRQSGE